MVYTLRFISSKCSLFHNSNVFGSCIIHILYTGGAKVKKKFRRQKVNVTGFERGGMDSYGLIWLNILPPYALIVWKVQLILSFPLLTANKAPPPKWLRLRPIHT